MITDALSSSEENDKSSLAVEESICPSEPITAREAVDTLRKLLQSMKASGRTQEAAAIDFALDTMKFGYAWISSPVP